MHNIFYCVENVKPAEIPKTYKGFAQVIQNLFKEYQYMPCGSNEIAGFGFNLQTVKDMARCANVDISDLFNPRDLSLSVGPKKTVKKKNSIKKS